MPQHRERWVSAAGAIRNPQTWYVPGMVGLTGDDKKKFLRERLEEQRHLLQKSIREFASGDLAEAVRLAVAMRVLVHETGSCKPLLGQLASNYLDLAILDRAPAREEQKLPPGTQRVVVMSVPISVKISEKGVFLNPDLDLEAYAPSILGKWWMRPCLILPGLGGFSRKEIALGLADKEGGAHVDVNVSPRYQQLMASKQFQIGWEKEGVTPLNLSRFMTAQAAIELLDCLNKNFR
jgi:hypothetical protein